MNHLTWLWIHCSTAALFGCVAYLMASVVLKPGRRVVVIAFLAAGLAFLPVGSIDVTGFVVAHSGILSVTTVLALFFRVATTSSIAESSESEARNLRSQVLVTSALCSLAGVPLYSSALGLVGWDVYSTGFWWQSSMVVLVLSAFLAVRGIWLPAISIAAAVVATNFQVFDTSNLWHALLDPWIVIGSAYEVMKACLFRRE